MLNEVLEMLSLEDGDVAVDGTLGLGGHALEIVKGIGVSGKLLVFEQDERNLKVAKERLQEYGDQIIYINDNFCYLKTRLAEVGVEKIDAALFDLGLSSPHVDDAERGFSFMNDGPLDMRFDPRAELTAAKVVNTYPEEELTRIFWLYGEERFSKKIARKICERRESVKFSSTVEFADFLSQEIPKVKGKHKGHPATKIFQALRIEVNHELEVLEELLPQVFELLNVGGRVVFISYHSLEDRVVKQFFKALERPVAEGDDAIYSNFSDPYVESLTKKPLVPSNEEVSANPRSRSAKLRAYKKIKEKI